VPDQLNANAFRQQDIFFRHIARLSSLPFHHRDPFDRLLAAQALEEGLAIVSADAVFNTYGLTRVW
jgi:PIN domain nuclease of toxin-antitoxin system